MLISAHVLIASYTYFEEFCVNILIFYMGDKIERFKPLAVKSNKCYYIQLERGQADKRCENRSIDREII